MKLNIVLFTNIEFRVWMYGCHREQPRGWLCIFADKTCSDVAAHTHTTHTPILLCTKAILFDEHMQRGFRSWIAKTFSRDKKPLSRIVVFGNACTISSTHRYFSWKMEFSTKYEMNYFHIRRISRVNVVQVCVNGTSVPSFRFVLGAARIFVWSAIALRCIDHIHGTRTFTKRWSCARINAKISRSRK